MKPHVSLTGFATVTPDNWGLGAGWHGGGRALERATGVPRERLRERLTNALARFVGGLYDSELGALHHYYRPDIRYLSEIDSGNFLMALNLVVLSAITGEGEPLERAESCYRYAMEHFCDRHPMAFWQGGIRDGFKPTELWVKYTGDAAWLALSLYRRTRKPEYLRDLRQFHNFFKRAREADFAYTFDTASYAWRHRGNVWQAFGFPVTAYLELYQATDEAGYREEAVRWGRHALELQASNGAFYLLDGQFWNSDLTAPELRGLVNLWEITGERPFLDAAAGFADWLLGHQREDGAWPLGIDRDDEVCVETVGPGDPPNIALSLLRLHAATGNDAYLDAAVRAVRYGLSMQACEEGAYPEYLDDPRAKWGFWSWEPLQDHSLSGDQSIHHVRGTLFLASYLAALGAAGKLPASL